MSTDQKGKKLNARDNSVTSKKKNLKATLAHHSLPVALTPGASVTVKLVKSGYITQEFSYTVPAAAATVTKTMVAERAIFKVTSASITSPTGAIYPDDIVGLSVTVKNEGNKADTGKITMRWDVVTAPTQVRSIATIVPGASMTFADVAFGVPADATPGAHTIKLEAKPDTETVATGMYDLPITIIEKPGTLSVTTTPTGATASISGIAGTFTTPFTKGDLLPGTITLYIEKAGYQKFSETVPIIAGETTTKSYTLTPAKGTLSITTTPTGATVKVGAETKTSPCNFTLAPGTHTVTISKSGYDTITDSVTITAGLTTTKSYTLTLLEVTITFDTKKEDGSTLTGVEVFVNGVSKGVT